jgi:hypothetical protein
MVFKALEEILQARRCGQEPLARPSSNPSQGRFIRARRTTEELLQQAVRAVNLVRGAGRVIDDAPRRGGLAAVKKRVAKAFSALADRSMHFILFIALGAFRYQIEGGCGFPMRVLSGEECLCIRAAIEGV